MIILLEGPDGAGKTSVAQKLLVHHASTRGGHVHLQRRGPIRHDVFTEYLRPLDGVVAHSASDIWIFDRWHVGELIYGPLLRGRSELTERQAAYLEMVLQTLGTRFIHITASPDVLESTYDQRGDGLIKRDWLPQLRTAYFQYVEGKSHWTTYSRGTADHDVVIDGAFPSICHREAWGRYVGPSRPDVLLLGDRRNEDTYTWPFVPKRASSGHWLMGSLAAADIDHMRVGIVNACELRPADLDLLWYDLGKPPVVTLGNNANDAWRALSNPERHRKIPHPQYQRRFHYQRFEEYGNLIKEVMKKE